MDAHSGSSAADSFTRMWTDMLASMSSAAVGQAFGASKEDAAKQMRQAFFDAWAKACDEYMHSPQFLDLMKRSMDGAIAFREQMNKFLSNVMEDGVLPSRDDTDSILQAVRTLEDRVLDRLEALSQRVEALEATEGGSTAARGSRGRSKGGTR
jgi:hypothetical protein